MASDNSTLKKYWRPALILLVLVLIVWLAVVSSAVLIPFLIGILIAYLLMPLVKWLEKRLPPKGKAQKSRRIISVIIIFVAFFVVVTLFIAYIGSVVVAASSVLIDKAPLFISQSLDRIGEWAEGVRHLLPGPMIAQLESTLQNLGPSAGKYLQDFVVGSMAVIPASMPTVTGFIILPFFLFFILMDYEVFKKFFYEHMPASTAKRASDVLGIIGNVLGRYIRSTIILSLIVGVLVFIGLAILGIQYAPALGAITTVTQFIPIVGPFISGVIILIITLALHSDKVIWALLVFVLAQVILNTVFLNWIQGKYMQIHPAVVMVLLVVGGYVAGFWGMILALPVAATIWEILKYFRSDQQAKKLQT